MKRFPNACVAVLAAGASERMGACKLLMPFAGSTLLDRALRAACCSQAGSAVVVTGAYREAVAHVVQAHGASESFNPDWHRGQSSSVRAAAQHAAKRGCSALVVMVADQPFVEARHIDALLDAHDAVRADACVAAVGGHRGNPCAFDARCFPNLQALDGDEGARALLRSDFGMSVHVVSFDDARLFDDVDTPQDAARVSGGLCRGGA